MGLINMTIQEFINKYDGKSIDWDNAYGGQCVDLFRQYCNEVLGISQPRSVNGAADFWSNYDNDSVLNQNFTKIKNSAEFIPQAGDVAIWNRNMGGGFGHIAVCTGKGDTNTFQSFDQNWSRVSFCELVTHNYVNFYGVLRFNKPLTENIYRGYDLSNVDSMKVCVDDHIRIVEGQLVDKNLYESIKGELKKANEQIESLSRELGAVRGELKEALESAKTAKEALANELNDQLDWAKVASDEQEAHKITKDTLSSLLWELNDSLKISQTSDDTATKVSVALEALQKLIQTNVSYETKVKDLENEVKRLNTHKKPIDQLTSTELFIAIVERLFKRS